MKLGWHDKGNTFFGTKPNRYLADISWVFLFKHLSAQVPTTSSLNYPLSTVLAFFFLGFFSSLSSTGNEIARYWAFVSGVFPQKDLGTLESPPVTAAWAVTSKVLSRESPSALLFGRILGRNHWGLRHGKEFYFNYTHGPCICMYILDGLTWNIYLHL